MKAVILAGGSGTRLWPLSRRNFPKQFLKLNRCHDDSPCAFDRGSLIQQTVVRLLKAVRPEDIVIMTNDAYRFHVKADLDTVSQEVARHIILEPAGRNTAPAIALALSYCTENIGCCGDEVVFVSPSDHIIEPDETFVQCLMEAERIAQQGRIVTFGITPRYADTGFGYIKVKRRTPDGAAAPTGNEFFEVERFTEKAVAAVADESPLVLLLDDVHWSDPTSRDVIRAILDRLPAQRVLAVTAARPSPEAGLTTTATHTLTLSPLSSEEVGSLVASLGALPGIDWAVGLPAALHEATAGSPLLVLDTLHWLIERALLFHGPDGWECSDPAILHRELAAGSALRRRVADLDREPA